MAKAKSKMEFDKDYIYNLIMPSGGQAPAPQQGSAPQQESPPRQEAAPQASPAAAPPAPEDSGPDPFAALKQRIFSYGPGVAMPAARREYAVVNLMELIVTDRLDAAFEKFNCCKCDKCRKDATAYALNLLPAEYVVAEPQEIAKFLSMHPTQEAASAIVKALLFVRSHPKH